MSDDEDVYPYISKVEVGYVKGKINGVTIRVQTDFGDGGNHTIHFGRSTSTHGDAPVERLRHEHPWGDRVKSNPHAHANDAIDARNEALDEMERRNLLDEEKWHE